MTKILGFTPVMNQPTIGSILKNSGAKLLNTPLFLECKLDGADNPIKYDKLELLSGLKKKQVKFQIEHDDLLNPSSQNEADPNQVKGKADQ